MTLSQEDIAKLHAQAREYFWNWQHVQLKYDRLRWLVQDILRDGLTDEIRTRATKEGINGASGSLDG